MTVNDASLGESGSKLSKVAATSLLMGVTRASSEAYVNGNSDKKGSFRFNNYDQLIKDKEGWISENVYYYAKGYDEFLKKYEQAINKIMNL